MMSFDEVRGVPGRIRCILVKSVAGELLRR